jgi:uncharacterized protein (TIGR03083 family)
LNKAEIVRTIRGERRRTLDLLESLDPAQFEVSTALPGWRVREVVAHLVTTDRASVTGAILPAALGGVARLEAWNERHVPKSADRPVPDLLLALDRWGRRFARLAATVPAAAYRAPLPNPWGPTLGMVLWVRAYDEWVHRQDIRRALNLPDDQTDLDEIAEFLLQAVGYLTVRRLGGKEGAVALSLTGAAVPEWAIDLAGRRAGPNESLGKNASVARIVASAPAFIMAAAGRDQFEELRARGSLHVEGDDQLASEFLTDLLIV